MSIRNNIDSLVVMALIRDRIVRGLFPTERPFVRSLQMSRRNWDYKNNEFEYRTQLSTPNTAGTLSSQVLTPDGAMKRIGNMDVAIQKATYGTVIGGFAVDMFKQRETENQPQYMDDQIGADTKNARYDMANTAARIMLGGKFMVLFQVTEHIRFSPNMTSRPPLGDYGQSVAPPEYSGNALQNRPTIVGFTPVPNSPFRIRVPADVMGSGYTQGMLFIKATGRPGGRANAREAYVLIDIQPNGDLELLPIGEPSQWRADDFIEAYGNRLADGTVEWREPSMATYPFGQWTFVGNATRYLNEIDDPNAALVGAFEGVPDLIPWYFDQSGQRMGLDVPFRGRPNRRVQTAQMAGNAYLQTAGQSIMDAIESGVAMSRITVPQMEMVMYINPALFPRINAEEGESIRRIDGVQLGNRAHYNQGAQTISLQVGNYNVPLAIADPSLPTDVVLIGPRDRFEYIGWGNPMAGIDAFMDAEFGNTPPQAATEINVPTELIASLDLSRLVSVSAPKHGDAAQRDGLFNVKPETLSWVAMKETGALFTEAPHAFTVVKLLEPSFVGSVQGAGSGGSGYY